MSKPLSRRPRVRRRKAGRETNPEPFDKWLKEALELKRSDPERYEREVKDVVKVAVENYERATKEA